MYKKTPAQIQKDVKFLEECIRVEGLLRKKPTISNH